MRGRRGAGAEQERQLFRFLESWQRRQGGFPSYREIASALGWKSTSTVSSCIDRLVRDGRLEKEPGKARSFRLRKYRRSRFLRRQAEELEVRRPGREAGGAPGTVWVDRGWAGGGSLSVWEFSGPGQPFPGMREGDLLVVDGTRGPAAGELVAALLGGDLLVGILGISGSRKSLRVSEEPEIVVLFGQGGLSGKILGPVVALLRRYRAP